MHPRTEQNTIKPWMQNMSYTYTKYKYKYTYLFVIAI